MINHYVWSKDGSLHVLELYGWRRAFVWLEGRYRVLSPIGTGAITKEFECSNLREAKRIAKRHVVEAFR